MDQTDKITNAEASDEQRSLTGTITVVGGDKEQITTEPPNPPPAALDPTDLFQFRLRRQAVEQAALASAMIQEGYRVWAQEIRVRYGLLGAFDVDIETGKIVERPIKEAENG